MILPCRMPRLNREARSRDPEINVLQLPIRRLRLISRRRPGRKAIGVEHFRG
jgi:hypothetical protein